MIQLHYGFFGVTVEKNLHANAGDAKDMGSIPRSGRSPGEENGNLLQYPCLEKSHGQRSLVAAVHGLTNLTRLSTITSDSLQTYSTSWNQDCKEKYQ